MSVASVLASGEQIQSLTSGQYSTVYNLLSLAIASLGFTALFLVFSQNRVAPAYRHALVVSATVCGIATYHYFRIFNNFKDSYPAGATTSSAHVLSNVAFNEAYRYVDWFLTVPLLLVETVAVMRLARPEARGLLYRLVPASALMIGLGYPGELSTDTGTRLIWGTLSTLPFIYLLYVLFVQLTASIERQPANVRHTISMLRVMLVGLWGVYPIAYLFPVFGGSFFGGAGGFVLRQVGYSLADIFAKAAYGLVIYKIARRRSEADEPDVYGEESSAQPSTGRSPKPARAGR